MRARLSDIDVWRECSAGLDAAATSTAYEGCRCSASHIAAGHGVRAGRRDGPRVPRTAFDEGSTDHVTR